jgi:hypothetical protein
MGDTTSVFKNTSRRYFFAAVFGNASTNIFTV